MDKESALQILNELAQLNHIVQYIREHYDISTGITTKVRRGDLQRQIADELGMVKNPQYWELIKKASKYLELKEITVNGIKYYKHIQARNKT